MSLFNDIRNGKSRTATPNDSDDVDEPRRVATTAGGTTRGETVSVAGQQVPVADPGTEQTSDDVWLTGENRYGWPRGREALEARQISQTSAMQSIINAVVDQLTGGELVFESDDDETDSAEAELQALLRDVITGPHLMDDDLDDLIAAAVDDMMGPGNAYWQLLPSENGDLPVVSMVPLDALTIRHNYSSSGMPQDPPYYQAPDPFTDNGGWASMGNISVTELDSSQLAVMRYPKGRRSHSIYPKSPSIQVREWLELLVNSTTHHDRFYDDNKIPPGLLQIMGESNLDDIRDRIESSKGDPREAPIIGGDGQAMWVEMGGSSVNLNVIEEQRWFFQLCLAAVGLGKQELGFIEDVNRSNGEVESSRVYKRITRPFAKQFEEAFRKIANQFEVYESLDRPFDPKLRFTDPREERAREERLRNMYNDGGLTLRQYIRRRGDEDLADNDLTVNLNGQVIDYGDHPKHVVDHLLREARADPDANADMGDDGDSGDGEGEV